jgi:hypothetical protein
VGFGGKSKLASPSLPPLCVFVFTLGGIKNKWRRKEEQEGGMIWNALFFPFPRREISIIFSRSRRRLIFEAEILAPLHNPPTTSLPSVWRRKSVWIMYLHQSWSVWPVGFDSCISFPQSIPYPSSFSNRCFSLSRFPRRDGSRLHFRNCCAFLLFIGRQLRDILRVSNAALLLF